MIKLAIVFLPRTEKKRPDQPFGMIGDRAFPYYIDKGKASKGKELEVGMVVLKEGTNFVDKDAWVAVSSHANNKPILDRLLRERVISVYEPDVEKQGRETTDFSTFEAVEDIVNNCFDAEWLTFCLQIDRRTGESDEGDVRQLINRRLAELQDLRGVRQESIGAFV